MSTVISRILQALRRHEIVHQFVKYATVGALNVLTFLALFNLFRTFLSVLPSYVLAFIPSNLNSFILNKRWAFRDDRTHAVGLQYMGFAFVTGISLVINTGLFTLFLIPLRGHGRLGENIAAMLPLPVSVAWNFLSYRYWTFRRGYRRDLEAQDSAAT